MPNLGRSLEVVTNTKEIVVLDLPKHIPSILSQLHLKSTRAMKGRMGTASLPLSINGV